MILFPLVADPPDRFLGRPCCKAFSNAWQRRSRRSFQ